LVLPQTHTEPPHAGPRSDLTEAEARAALAAFDGPGGLEPWIADQRWEAVPGGWRVRERFQDWHFRVEPVAGGVSLVRSLP
jgi:hypothetical protein